jgi:parvulin-like peptidyl-prolyl isomerase
MVVGLNHNRYGRPDGAKCESPGQRPGNAGNATRLALKGRHRLVALLTFTALLLAASPLFAADPDAVAATVGSDRIRAGEVQRLAAKATRGKKFDAESVRILQAQVLEEVISRRLVLAYARRTGETPSDAELAAELAALKAQLAARRRTVDDFLKVESIRRPDLNRQLAWNVLWRKYVARYANEQRIASTFAARHRDFDGTQLVVSHILFRPSSDGAKTTEELMKQAAKVRDEIVAGKLTFEDAARKYSTGPSSENGGRLGTIGRHGPMNEPFSRAAFALDEGKISEPVKTSFGIHLIRCDEIEPGTKRLADVRKELEDALSRELLEKLANVQRQYTPIDYTAVLPHFKPGTHELESTAKPSPKSSGE